MKFGPYPAKVEALVDADSALLSIDVGFDHLISAVDFDGKSRLICRVFGINAPELATDAGRAALEYALTILKPGDRCQVVSHGWDKWGGRFLGSITLSDGSSYGGRLIDAGHAKIWDGQGTKPV